MYLYTICRQFVYNLSTKTRVYHPWAQARQISAGTSEYGHGHPHRTPRPRQKPTINISLITMPGAGACQTEIDRPTPAIPLPISEIGPTDPRTPISIARSLTVGWLWLWLSKGRPPKAPYTPATLIEGSSARVPYVYIALFITFFQGPARWNTSQAVLPARLNSADGRYLRVYRANSREL